MAESWRDRWDNIGKQLSASELKVLVSDPSKAGNSTMSRHVSYRVTTKNFGYVVQRRYSDFGWLRSSLEKRFPGLFLPALPPKELAGNTFSSAEVDPSSKFILNRLQQLRFFLSSLVKIHLLRGDPGVVAFLSCQDEKEFEAAKLQTAQQSLLTDLSEGAVAWREGLTGSSPQHWDRLTNDFKKQLEAVDKDAKQLSSSIGALADQLSACAVSSGKVMAAAEEMLATESKLGDGTKFEFPNQTSSPAAQTASDAFNALSSANQADLAQPDNWELVLRAGCKFLSYQVVAFKEYLKVRDTQNALVMKLTTTLDKHLENQRNGKPVKSGSIFGAKASEEDIIAAAKAELETETTQLNFMTSALEFSEVDRFHFERSAFMREMFGIFAAAQRQQAVERQRAWDQCMTKLGVDFDEAMDQMERTNPLMRSLKTGPAPPLGKVGGGAAATSGGGGGGGASSSAASSGLLPPPPTAPPEPDFESV